MQGLCAHCRKEQAIGECGTHKTGICEDCADGDCTGCMQPACDLFVGRCLSCRPCGAMNCHGGMGEFTCVSEKCKGMYFFCSTCAGADQKCGMCGSHLVGKCAEIECNEISTVLCVNVQCRRGVCHEHHDYECTMCGSDLEGMCSSKGCVNRGRVTARKEFLCEKCHAETQTWNTADIVQCQYCNEVLLSSAFDDPVNRQYCKSCVEYCTNLAQGFTAQG